MNDDRAEAGTKPLTDDELDELGTRAGTALRVPAPAHGPEIAIRAAHRRQAVRAVGVAGVLIVLVGGAAMLATSRPDTAPADSTTPSPPPTTSPATPLPGVTVPPPTSALLPPPPSAPGTTMAHAFSEYELGPRLDLERWFSLSLTGDRQAVQHGCGTDPSQCVVELIDARTLQPVDSVTCPNMWIDGEPAIDIAAMPGFLARFPDGQVGRCGAYITDRVVVAQGRGGEASSRTTFAFDTTTGAELWRRELVNLAELSPDGDVVVGTEASGAQVVLDALTGNVISTLPSGFFLYFDPTGRYMLSANHLDVADVSTGTIVYHAEAYYGLFDQSGAMLVTVGEEEIALVDTSTWTERWSIPTRGTGYSVDPNPYRFGGLSPDGSILALGSPAVLIDTATGAHIATLSDVCGSAAGRNEPDPYEWLPDGRTLIFQCLTVLDSLPAWLQVVTLGPS